MQKCSERFSTGILLHCHSRFGMCCCNHKQLLRDVARLVGVLNLKYRLFPIALDKRYLCRWKKEYN